MGSKIIRAEVKDVILIIKVRSFGDYVTKFMIPLSCRTCGSDFNTPPQKLSCSKFDQLDPDQHTRLILRLRTNNVELRHGNRRRTLRRVRSISLMLYLSGGESKLIRRISNQILAISSLTFDFSPLLL